MKLFIEFLIALPLLLLCFRLYSYSVNCEGREKQDNCLMLGIVFMTVGIMALVFRLIIISFFGLILMMFGFRLMAAGLGRSDNTKHIDLNKDNE